MASDTPSPILLRGARVFDSEARSFADGVDMLLADGRIARRGPEIEAPDGARAIDAGGMSVLPGLIDCHVHLASSGDIARQAEERADPAGVIVLRAAVHARLTLEAGFTTVRDLGAPYHVNIHLARAIERRLTPGPKVLAAGFGVTMTGGHGHGWIGREADGPDEVRKAVREQLRAGAGAIKLFASGGVMTRGVNPRSPSFSEEELRAGVEEAHKAFRVVGAHAQATEGIKNAVRAGVDSIEHAVWLDDEAIELMLAHGTYLVATLTAPHHIINGGIGGGVPAWVLDKRADEILRDHIASFKRACAAGVKLAMGTDQGTPLNRPGENAQEIVHLQAQGLSPGAAIMAATGWAADLLRVADDRGRIAEGLAADLLLLRGDPLRDPAILAGGEHPRAVVLDGDIVHDTLGIGGG